MIPNRAVAERATITRLCARLPLRSLMSIPQYSVTMVDCAEITTPLPEASRITGIQGWKRNEILTVTLPRPGGPIPELYQIVPVLGVGGVDGQRVRVWRLGVWSGR